MLERNDVISLYNILLDRAPESEKTINNYINRCKSIYEAMRLILNSQEYKNKVKEKIIPQKMIPSRIMVYLHIPKTAGTYLRTGWLLNNVSNYFWVDEHREYPKLVDLEKSYLEASEYGLIGGHKEITSFLNINTLQPRVFMSVLRDPIERIISFYNHVKHRDKNHPLHKTAQKYSLYDWLIEKRIFYNIIKNEQIRYLVADNKTIKNFTDKDILIIGKQEKLDSFISNVNDICELKFKNVVEETVLHNKGVPSYRTDIKKEPNYEKALSILQDLTKIEYEFYNSLGKSTILKRDEYLKLCRRYMDIRPPTA